MEREKPAPAEKPGAGGSVRRQKIGSTDTVIHSFVSGGVQSRDFLVDPDCAPTVHESNVFIPFGLLLSEKQFPRFVGNVSS